MKLGCLREHLRYRERDINSTSLGVPRPVHFTIVHYSTVQVESLARSYEAATTVARALVSVSSTASRGFYSLRREGGPVRFGGRWLLLILCLALLFCVSRRRVVDVVYTPQVTNSFLTYYKPKSDEPDAGAQLKFCNQLKYTRFIYTYRFFYKITTMNSAGLSKLEYSKWLLLPRERQMLPRTCAYLMKI